MRSENWDETADGFKPLDSVLKADPRRGGWNFDGASRSFAQPQTLDNFHSDIATLELHAGVTDLVRIHFDTARNVLLYSWFVYRFVHVAELHAFATVELALKEVVRPLMRCEKPPSLRRMLDHAVEEGLVQDSGFREYARAERTRASWRAMVEVAYGIGEAEEAADASMYARKLVRVLPERRNEFAHGSTLLHGQGLLPLEVCCDLINQLYPRPT